MMTQSGNEAEDYKVSQRNRRRYRKSSLLILAAIFIFIGIIWLLYYLIWGQFEVYTDDAYVNGNLVELMSQVSGTVTQINTDDTFFVEQGQLLLKLDPADAEIALQKATAALAETVRKVRQYYETAKQAEANVTQSKVDFNKAKLDYVRRNGLVEAKAISAEEYQHYKTEFEATRARLNSAFANLQSAYALIDHSNLYQHPEVERAKANFKEAYLNYVRTTVVAPISGFVAKRSVQVGQQIAINTPLLAIVPLHDVWVDANYKESQLNFLRIGQPVTLYADAYSGVTYHGKVIGLNAGTGAAFALLPPQNATGNWIKIVQRLPVRIGLDSRELQNYPLMIGLSMHVTTDIHNVKGLRLATKASTTPIYSTTVYNEQLADANKLINRILEENSPNVSLSRLAMTIRK